MPRLLSVLLALLVSAFLAAPAAGAPKKNPKSPQETSAYWTEEKMKSAKPRDRAKPGGGGGGKPAKDWSRYSVPLSGGAYAGENRKVGKVFFTIDGANYVCSGTAVTATTGVNLVWTAGHCLTDGPGHDATNFMFVPGYYNGQEPNGRWAYTVLDSTPGWEAQGTDKWRYDVGAARVVNTTNSAATFDGTIGTKPIAFGQNPTGKRLVSHGYPAAGTFNGQTQFACASPFRRWDWTALLDPMQISCDMTGGSSGGGWMLDANGNSVADAGEPVVSVNSYGYQGEKNTMYGPYMPVGGQHQALYESLK
jgi:V8-like Glu-specific endopeptidase